MTPTLSTFYRTIDASPQTPDGLARRRGIIGASEASAVLGLSRYAGPVTIWASKLRFGEVLDLDALEDSDGESAGDGTQGSNLMQALGHVAEPVILRFAYELAPHLLPSMPVRGLPTILHRAHPMMGANLDGACLTADGMIEVVVEAKHWMPRDAFDIEYAERHPTAIPVGKVLSAWLQMQHQMHVCGCRRAVLAALCGKRLVLASFDYDPTIASMIEAEVLDLWQHVERGTRPRASGADLGELRKIAREVGTVDVPQLAPVLRAYVEGGRAATRAKQERDNCAAEIRQAMGTASILTAGHYRASRSATDRLTVTGGSHE